MSGARTTCGKPGMKPRTMPPKTSRIGTGRRSTGASTSRPPRAARMPRSWRSCSAPNCIRESYQDRRRLRPATRPHRQDPLPMAGLVLGPLLRYVGRTTATVWVETDAACEVDVLGRSARTFVVSGHHSALVPLTGLPEGAVLEYEVRRDGEPVWPPRESGRPPSTIHPREGEDRARLVFGSCRVGAPQREPYTRPPSEEHGFGVDALWAYSARLQEGLEPWPDGLLLCGDQVYADEVSPETLEFIRSRRDTSQPPGEQIADSEEYTRLYREAWSDPDIRWLLSTVPSLMVFDDHDVIDDWNISWQWLTDIRSQPWWQARITGAYMAYWLYQHLGNLSPPELDEDPMYRTAVAAAGDVRPE